MLQPLKALVAAVTKMDPAARWFFVGDYVNRGPDSKGVIDFLLKLPGARFCRGNHDDIFDVIVNGESFAEEVTHNERPAAFRWFMDHGLAETLISYGATLSDLKAAMAHPTVKVLDELTARVPASHRQFIRNLPAVIEEPDLFITHARWDPDIPDEDPSPTTFLEVDQELRKTVTWGRFSLAEVDMPKTWRRTAYFGHTPVDSYGARGGYDPKGGGKLVPVMGNKMVLIDTAAALSPVGRLTAFCPDKTTFVQVDRIGNPIL
jgi:hypothetical protein